MEHILDLARPRLAMINLEEIIKELQRNLQNARPDRDIKLINQLIPEEKLQELQLQTLAKFRRNQTKNDSKCRQNSTRFCLKISLDFP